MDILIVLFAVFFLTLSIIRIDWALMFLLVGLPVYLIRSSVFGIPFSLLELMILISFSVWFFRSTEFRNFIHGKYGWKEYRKNRKERIKYPFGLEICLILIFSFLAVIIAGLNNSALGIWKAYFFEPLLLYLTIINVFREDRRKIIWPLLVSAFFVSIIAIIQKFTGWWIFNELWADAETRRVTSVFGYPNAVGLYLAPLLMLFFGFLFEKKRLIIEKIGVICVISLSFLAIVFARSEGALVGIAVGLIVFGILANKKTRLATLVFVIFIGSGVLLYQPSREYFLKKATLSDLSGEIRKQQWKETLDMLGNEKITSGSGLANYQNAIKPYHQEGIFFNKDNDPDFRRKIVIFDDTYRRERWQPVEIYMYPHNIFLNFWTELGLVGLILFVWIIGKYFFFGFLNIRANCKQVKNKSRETLILDKYLNLGLICAMLVIVVHGMVDVPYFKNDLSAMFWILMALMALTRLENKYKS